MRSLKKSVSRSQLEKKLWTIFSSYIRLRDKKLYNGLCPFCHLNPIECAFHFIPRGRRATKYDELNVIGSCSLCNYKEFRGRSHNEFIAWFIYKHGEKSYLDLVEKSKTTVRHGKADIMELIDHYKKKLENNK